VVNSLEKFKAQYPTGALIADLVSVNEGQYVVRAAVMLKGETLATGLAAHIDVQMAEDKARERAIAALGIFVESPAISPAISQLPLSQSSVFQPAISQPPLSQPSVFQLGVSQPEVEDVVIYTDTEALPEEDDLGPPIDAIDDAIEEGAQAATPKSTAKTAMESVEPAKPSAAVIALENFSTSAKPVDLSDVIAQTDVELTRLGWTSTQGREYLEQNYGKRSRQQLTDEELMSFLLYLEAQP